MRIGSVVIAVGLIAGHSMVFANNGEPAETSESQASLAEVVVTAQKREERLIDVPISVAVVTKDEIDRRRLVNAEDYLRGIPGVNQVDAAFGQSIVIRGLETSPAFQNFAAGTTVALRNPACSTRG